MNLKEFKASVERGLAFAQWREFQSNSELNYLWWETIKAKSQPRGYALGESECEPVLCLRILQESSMYPSKPSHPCPSG